MDKIIKNRDIYLKLTDVLKILDFKVNRYRSNDKLINVETKEEYPEYGNELFIVEDVFDALDQLERYVKE